MYIYEMHYNLKPGTDTDELIRMFDELAVPVCRKIPGFLFCTIYQCSVRSEDKSPEWDYLYIEAWENKEVYDKAMKDKLIGPAPGTEIYKTGFAEKFMSVLAESSSVWATSIYASK